MKAFQCDRCKRYDTTPAFLARRTWLTHWNWVYTKCGWSRWHICSACNDSFKNWFDGGRND